MTEQAVPVVQDQETTLNPIVIVDTTTIMKDSERRDLTHLKTRRVPRLDRCQGVMSLLHSRGNFKFNLELVSLSKFSSLQSSTGS